MENWDDIMLLNFDFLIYVWCVCVCVCEHLYSVCMLSSISILVNVENQMVKHHQQDNDVTIVPATHWCTFEIRKKSKPKSIYLNQSDEIKVKRKHLSDRNTNKWKANKGKHSSNAKLNQITLHAMYSNCDFPTYVDIVGMQVLTLSVL